jgi:hypothetical protein
MMLPEHWANTALSTSSTGLAPGIIARPTIERIGQAQQIVLQLIKLVSPTMCSGV